MSRRICRNCIHAIKPASIVYCEVFKEDSLADDEGEVCNKFKERSLVQQKAVKGE